MRNNAGESPERRIRRRTVMSPFQFTSIVLALAWLLCGRPCSRPNPGSIQAWRKRPDARA